MAGRPLRRARLTRRNPEADPGDALTEDQALAFAIIAWKLGQRHVGPGDIADTLKDYDYLAFRAPMPLGFSYLLDDLRHQVRVGESARYSMVRDPSKRTKLLRDARKAFVRATAHVRYRLLESPRIAAEVAYIDRSRE